jgi:hypothetical protein
VRVSVLHKTTLNSSSTHRTPPPLLLLAQATSLESNLDRDWRRGRVYTEMCDDNTALVVSPWAPVETQGQPLAARREARQRVMTLVLSLARACGGVDKMPLLPVEMWASIMSSVWAVHLIPQLAFHADTDLPNDFHNMTRAVYFSGDHVMHCPRRYQPVGSCTSLELQPSQHLGTAPSQALFADEGPRASHADEASSDARGYGWTDRGCAAPDRDGRAADHERRAARASSPRINRDASNNAPPLELVRVAGMLVWRPSKRRLADCVSPNQVNADSGSVSEVLSWIDVVLYCLR